MKRLHAGIGSALVVVVSFTAFAQDPAKKRSSGSRKDNAASSEEFEQRQKQRIAHVRSLLISLASDATSFRDQALRARTLSRIADTLWKVDPDQGRRIFRRAWEAAEISDQADTPYGLGQQPPNLRRAVINMVARRDRHLAEEFLQKLDGEKTPQSPEATTTTTRDGLRERLALAMSLLNSGDTERALQFADPVLNDASIATLDFLTVLRSTAPGLADSRYLKLLQLSSASPIADGNTISLLSSYLFSPNVYITFNTDGAGSSAIVRSVGTVPNVSAQLRQAFFEVGAGVLSRPQPSLEQDQRSTGVRGEYMVVKRLLPVFERYASADIVSLIRGQLEALSSAVNIELREENSEALQKGLASDSTSEHERSLETRLERAKSGDERDAILFQLALVAVAKNELRAREYVSRIDESSFRKQAESWVDANLAIGAIRSKNVETALELTRNGALTHILKAWVFSQAADIVAKGDRDQAAVLLNESATEANRLDKSDPDRPRALMAIANVIRRVDPSRTWEVAFDAIKAANSTTGFTGEGGAISLNLSNRGQVRGMSISIPDFDIEGFFRALAKSDFERSLQLARGFQDEALRAVATIAIADALLTESPRDRLQSR